MEMRPGTRAGSGAQRACYLQELPRPSLRSRSDSAGQSQVACHPAATSGASASSGLRPGPLPGTLPRAPGRAAELTAGPPEADGEAWRRGPAASRCSGAAWAEGLCEPRASPSARGGASGAAAGGPAERRDSIFQRHEAIIISGTDMAQQIQKEIQQGVESWIALGNRRPHLSIILVGDNPASHTYVRNKIKAASAVGICSELIIKPKNVSQEELLDITDQLNMDPRVSGILVQLPLPDHVDERTICNGIAPEKDVDGFHIINIGRLCLDQHSLIPATASAVWEIIKRAGIKTFGKNVVVAGRSKNVGMPIAMLLHTDGEHERPGGDATVTIAHRYTPREQLKAHTQLADIIIVAAGIPRLITADMVREGAAVIDVGINYIQDPVTGKTKLVGDVDFEAVKKKASFITPVPGGVGPMTVSMLLKNTLLAAKNIAY